MASALCYLGAIPQGAVVINIVDELLNGIVDCVTRWMPAKTGEDVLI